MTGKQGFETFQNQIEHHYPTSVLSTCLYLPPPTIQIKFNINDNKTAVIYSKETIYNVINYAQNIYLFNYYYNRVFIFHWVLKGITVKISATISGYTPLHNDGKIVME